MRSDYNPLFLQVILIIGLLISGCSSSNQEAPLAGNAHPSSWSDPKLKNTEAFHGVRVQTDGTRECTTCHGGNLNGTGEVVGCRECHFTPEGSKIPVNAEWLHGMDRHHEFEADMVVCNTCHAHERDFGAAPEACHDCHGVGTDHVLGRALLDPNSPDFHGTGVLDTCSSCHDVSVKCWQCHFGSSGSRVPPGSSWTHGNNSAHADYVASQATCNQCHDLNRTYGNGPASCHDCHLHATGEAYLDKTGAAFHGDQAQDGCSDCHDMVADCGSCHFGSSGSRVPPGSSWTHGNNRAHQDLGSYRAVCNQCHDLNRSYGNGPGNCHDCH